MTEKQNSDDALNDRIAKLKEKYAAGGQDLGSYLDGLLHANYLTYWDYIHLDTLMSLQNPKTAFPDESVFIIYHQITELYFKLILSEIDQISGNEEISERDFLKRMRRINRYFAHLVGSYDVMVGGMEPKQFLQFRMSLLPASGFQSVQYRLIELSATDLIHLTDKRIRPDFEAETTPEKLFEHIYWRQGATELASGKKTLTLQMFEEKYDEQMFRRASDFSERNLLRCFQKLNSSDEKIKTAMREFDALVNVDWPLSHYGSAMRYLDRKPEVISATGGTNWQKYLPPKFQKIIFFPDLWSETEKEEWGKTWVAAKMEARYDN